MSGVGVQFSRKIDGGVLEDVGSDGKGVGLRLQSGFPVP